eukprot:scaffold43278_cov36-Cyclotella_meneghiniana.AAC.1
MAQLYTTALLLFQLCQLASSLLLSGQRTAFVSTSRIKKLGAAIQQQQQQHALCYAYRVTKFTSCTQLHTSKSNDEADSSNATTTANSNSKQHKSNKVAILFLHGLGDSAEGWSKLSSALPNVKPSLSQLDITY